MQKLKILTIFGTRPEVIKLAPFIKVVEEDSGCDSITCATTQQRELQNDVLNLFNIKADYDLEIMQDGQDLFHITESILHKIKDVLKIENPNVIVVQGDTTTAFSTALAGFYCKIPVVHIEAGLRTGNVYSPYPEEMNRCLISKLATLHMAPTQASVDNLAKEGVHQKVFNVGNTIVDAVHWILKNAKASSFVEKIIGTKKNVVLITVHRRENFGEPLLTICDAIKNLCESYPEYTFVWPVHPNPNVKDIVYQRLQGIHNLDLTSPLSYADLILLINVSKVILSDSGGIQEESCILGKKIIVLREDTERPEVIESGYGMLVGADKRKILSAFEKFIDITIDNEFRHVYGKPGVSERILNIIEQLSL